MPAQNVNINFSQGLDTKTDPWQVPIGKFERLENAVFQKGGLLQKRNGYRVLNSLSGSYVTTLNGNLIAIGDTVSAYSSSLMAGVAKGKLQPCSLDVLSLIKNNLNQSQCDAVVSNNLVCTTYTQTTETVTGIVNEYLFAIADATTGQNIAEPTAITPLAGGVISGSSRVFVTGRYFTIVSPCLIGGTTFLQYVAILISNPVNLTTNAVNVAQPQNVRSEAYVPISQNPGWDGVVVPSGSGDTLVIAYNTTAGGQAIHVTSLTEQQIAARHVSGAIVSFMGADYRAGVLSICADTTSSPAICYVSFWNPATQNGYTAAISTVYASITSHFSPQLIISANPVSNLASAAQNGSALVFSEVVNAYTYDATLETHFIAAVTVSSSGAVGTPYVLIRSVGLASKAFVADGSIYVLSAYESTFQPSYFLINGSLSTSAAPVITAKLAYENGGGYLTQGLPCAIVSGTTARIAYLFKDLVQALNTLNDTSQTTAGGIYSQTGINLVSFSLGTEVINTADIGGNLHISGGYLSHFDGYLPVEHNFFVWPDTLKATYAAVSTVTPTGTWVNGSRSIIVSSASGIYPGMTISDTSNPSFIPSGAVVEFVNGTTITISVATAGTGSSDNLSIQGNIAAKPDTITNTNAYAYQGTYEWTDNQGLPYRSAPSIPVFVSTSGSGTTGSVALDFPTLRLTQKVANPVKLVIYRWSVATQVYNQVTSIVAPLLNDTTVDSVSFVDTLSNASVIGNNLIYTTGGVVEDVNAPASDIMTLFDTRLVLVDSEDRNTLWVSKQVIKGTPVEMSDLFTIYIAPNTGTVGSTGPITAISPMDDKLVLFKGADGFAGSIYYINGVGPNILGTTAEGCTLGNYSQPTFVTSIVGCQNQRSIVMTQDGLMFQADNGKGIWLLSRGLGVSYIGAPVERYNSSRVTSAVAVPDSTRVLFTLDTGEYLMYDYYYQQWGTFRGASAISSCIYQGLHTILNDRGQILQETPGGYLDGSNPVLMAFTTSWINLAGLQGYERFYEFRILARYLSPHSLNCQVAYDYNYSVRNEKIITPQNYSSPSPSGFGIPTPFGSPGDKEQWRVHAKKQLCESFQLSISEVFNPAYMTIPGAGFTMSGINCSVSVRAGAKPIKAANAVGMA